MKLEVVCPACKKAHTFDGLVPFRSEFDACSADLHVCITCRFYDRYAENECREDQADPVAVKDRRNLCEYWRPAEAAAAADDAAARAKAKLAALFGGAPAATAPASSTSATDDAKAKLEALFKKPTKP